MDEEISKHVLKTGTLTIGIVCKDGIVIAADRRQSYAGQGSGVSYLAGSAKKIQEVTDRMIATTAGNASDTRKTLELIRAEFRIKELRTKETISVKEAANFLNNMVYHNIRAPSMIPNIGHFLFAGYDNKGTHLFDISPDGYIQEVETYSATGSGIMQAHPILDTEYKKGINIQDAITLVRKCIEAATGREPSVGAGMDIYTITKDSVQQVTSQEAVVEFKDTN
jgi:proteasome beta subunit